MGFPFPSCCAHADSNKTNDEIKFTCFYLCNDFSRTYMQCLLKLKKKQDSLPSPHYFSMKAGAAIGSLHSEIKHLAAS